MGAGGKMDPEKIRIDDISKTSYCKLAKVVRKRLADLGVRKGVQVVYSTEVTDESAVRAEDSRYKKSTVGTISYMPPLFGCYISSVVIRGLTSQK
jgi:tRNA A37 threonylcarbamoyladenosine dehydratase